MSHLKVTVNDTVLMNADSTAGFNTPDMNTFVKHLTNQGTTPEPWKQAIIHPIAEWVTLTMAKQNPPDRTITVTTHDDGWTVDVKR